MYDKEKLCDIITNDEYRTIDDKGNVFPPSHGVYHMISQTLENSGSYITPKHVYTIVKNNRNGIYNIVLQAFNVDKKTTCNDSKNSTFNVTDTSNTSARLINFELIISEEKWAQIKPTRQTYGRDKRKYMSLQPGKWTHIFADKIWQQTRLPCAFSFRHAKIYVSSDAKYYTRFKGTCKECGAQLVGILYKKPKKAVDVVFECTVAGFSTEIVHSKKRQLKGFLREKIATTLLDGNKTAAVWRNEEATKLMTFGDTIPPILYDTSVLRKAKQAELDKRLQLDNTDPLHNLHMAKCTRFMRTIHNIGLNPFYCMYWSVEQQLMYKKAHKEDPNCFLTIDATGSIAKKLRLPNGEKSPHLFLYECVCVSKVGNFPAFQMVSAKQDASIISYFLSEIIRNGAPTPRIVVSDFGKAILIAAARAFANCTDLQHYMQMCYNLINDTYSCNIIIPQCYIRLDISHFIGMVSKWECLRGRTLKIRQFFLRCLGRAYQIETFIEVQHFLTSMLIVILSEEIGLDESGTSLPSELHLRNINNSIKGVIIDDFKNDTLNYDYEETVVGSWTTWADNIFREAQTTAHNSHGGNVVNAYYNPEAAAKIKSLMSYLPLWTGIMRPYFKRGSPIASSSFVEATFSELKHRVFKNQLPLRVDKFIIRHLEYLEGKLLLTNSTSEKIMPLSKAISSPVKTSNTMYIDESFAIGTNKEEKKEEQKEEQKIEQKEEEKEEKKSKTEKKDETEEKRKKGTKENTEIKEIESENEITRESLNEIENWRCKIKKETSINKKETATKRIKSNYLTPCADWDLVPTNKNIGIPILRNGSICSATTMDSEQIVVRETCAFDSIVHIIVNSITMHENYKTYLNEFISSNDFIKLITDIVTRGKIIAKDYSARAKILCNIPIFNKTMCTRSISSINANCNAAHLSEYLFKNIPSSTTTYNCNNCSHSYCRTSPICNINVDVILKNGLNYMQEAINDNIIARKESSCSNCKQRINRTFSYGSHLIIDTSIFSDDNYIHTQNIEIKHNYALNKITKLVNVANNNYSLSGIASYIKYSNGIGHYVAFTYTGTTWYKYDDMTSKRTVAKPEEEICPHVIIYIKH